MKQLKTMWESRAPRERLVLAVLLGIVGALLYLWLLGSAQHARARLRASVEQLRIDAIHVDQGAEEVERLRALRPLTLPQGDLRTLLQTQLGTCGLAGSLVSIQAVESGQAPRQVKLVLGAVSFADWMACVDQLRLQQVQLAETQVSALPAPGMVSVTATFVRPGH
jgi:general secretion pathway protein M